MTKLRGVPSLVACSLLLACETPTAPAGPAPRQSAARLAVGSGCYPVTFHVTLPESSTAIYEGVLSGDLIGSVSVVFDLPGSLKFAGATVSNAGTATWTITGGTLPAPFTFATTFDNLNLLVDTPASPASIFENIGKHRATSGVTKANLQYKGAFDATSGIVDLEYWGVICP